MKKMIIKGIFLPIVSLFMLGFFGVALAQSTSLNDSDGSADSTCVTLQTPFFRYLSTDKNTNGEVSVLQDFLISKNFLKGSPSGFYGRLTVAAVKSYQRSAGVYPTGNVGSLTKGLIEKTTCSEAGSRVGASASPIVCAPGTVWDGNVCAGPVTTSTGTITLESSICTIPAGRNQCGVNVSWAVTNPVSGKTVVKHSWIDPLSYADSMAPTFFWNNKGENVNTYTLSNNGIVLDTKTVTSKCAPGTVWDGNVCAGPVSTNDGGASLVLGASTICLNLPSNLHRGAESSSVTKLQKFLATKGFLTAQPTGFYGDMTVEAVKLYQSTVGINPTGMVYELTRQAIQGETCN